MREERRRLPLLGSGRRSGRSVRRRRELDLRGTEAPSACADELSPLLVEQLPLEQLNGSARTHHPRRRPQLSDGDRSDDLEGRAGDQGAVAGLAALELATEQRGRRTGVL
jgi:hypothetical protein